MSDSNILSFHDSLLSKSDLKLLDGNQWLNDKLIGFAFEYFEKEVFDQFSTDVAFVSPDVTQFAKLASECDVTAFLEPLELCGKNLVFLAVNNQQDTESAGGSHWSLLVFNRNVGEFQHYDSFNDSNLFEAKQLAKKLKTSLKAEAKAKVVSKETPAQTNGCDCGLYVICITEQLTKLFCKMDSTPLLDCITPSYVKQYRVTLQEIILNLAAKQKT